MPNFRPSLGEFSGYFNINERDFEDIIGTGDWSESVLCDTDCLRSLKKGEDLDAKKSVADILAAHGVTSLDVYHMVHGMWPFEYFSIEKELIDRTVMVWLSSPLSIQHDLLEELRSMLSKHHPSWRVVMTLPACDAADIVVYWDKIRVCDRVDFSEKVLSEWRDELIKSINDDVKDYAFQFQSVNNSVPQLFLDNKKQVLLLQVFLVGDGTEMHTAGKKGFVFWFATSGGKNTPYCIDKLILGETEYKPRSRAVFGNLTSDNKWQFIAPPRAKGLVTLFDVNETDCMNRFEVHGKSSGKFQAWKFSGVFTPERISRKD